METHYVGVAYDASNPAHVAQWTAAGKPDLAALDSNGETWRPSATRVIDDSGAIVSEEVKSPRALPDSAKSTKPLDLAAAKAARNAINTATTLPQVRAALLSYLDARIGP